jgi:DNA-binding MarR family transcriptional regulator
MPDLPDPAEVEQLLGTMRRAVLEAYEDQGRLIREAEQMIEDARKEQTRIRKAYPTFFPDHQRQLGHARGTPTAQSQNQVLRVLAEHPAVTRRRLAKLVNYSESWVSQVIKELNAREGPAIVQYGRSGRMTTYTLTADGEELVNIGGVRDEEEQ